MLVARQRPEERGELELAAGEGRGGGDVSSFTSVWPWGYEPRYPQDRDTKLPTQY